MCSPFTPEELRAALAGLSTGKSPGVDEVPNELLTHLPVAAQETLLLLFNKSWETGAVPAIWRKAEIVAIPKKGKPLDVPESYRPISLLCSASKLLERLVQTRLQYWLESRHLITPNQAGFRKGHSTMDQIARITQSIFDSFEQPKPGRAALALLDFQRAYDRVWRAALLAKLARLRVPPHAIAWIRGFLSDRRARVKWGTATSRWKVFQEGLPQGSVLAPLLWLVYMNDIDQNIPEDVEVSLYADDVAILATDRSLLGCSTRLQPALDAIDAWTERWKVPPSVGKCSVTYFSLDPKETGGKVAPPVTLRGEQLRHELRPTFLGVTLDDQLTFSAHIASLRSRMAKRRQCLQALSGKKYGSKRKTLRTAYISYIRAIFDYGAAAHHSHAAPTTRQLLEVEQNKCARAITGCLRLTNTKALLTEAGLPSLSTRAKLLTATEVSRFKRLPDDDPTRRTFANGPKPKLAYRGRESWRRACAEATRSGKPDPEPPDRDVAALSHRPCIRRVGEWVLKEAGIAGAPAAPVITFSPTPPWERHPDRTTFIVTLPEKTRRTDSPTKRRLAAQRAIEALPPADVTIWTDGSSRGNDAAGGGGARIDLHREQRTLEVTAPAGLACSSTAAELVAIRAGLEAVLALPEDSLGGCEQVNLLTDSKASLLRLSRGHCSQTSGRHLEIWRALHRLADRGIATTFQWVPGHAGIEGNEAADSLANQAAAAGPQETVPLDLMAVRTAVNKVGRAWTKADSRRHPHPKLTPGHDNLTRKDQVTISQLRVERSPLTREVLHRIGRAADPLCRDCGDIDTVRHLLTECPAHCTARSNLWGGPLPTLESVLEDDADRIIEYLRRAGRDDPPVDAATADPPAGGGPCDVKRRRRRRW